MLSQVWHYDDFQNFVSAHSTRAEKDKMRRAFTVAALCCSLLLLCEATHEGAVSVKLSKKPLHVDRILQQRQIITEKYALGSSNRGEDIPLLDFMDAQVSLAQGLLSALRGFPIERP